MSVPLPQSRFSIALNGTFGVGRTDVAAVVVGCPKLLARARELDEALGLGKGRGVVQTVLGVLIGEVAAGDYERVLCGWSFRHGEAWAEQALERLRRRWLLEDAGPDPGSLAQA